MLRGLDSILRMGELLWENAAGNQICEIVNDVPSTELCIC